MLNIPSDAKKIRARIRSYERKLRKEKESYGDYDDGAGKRFLLGPLYMVMGDQDGALESFRWYEKEFPDDGGDPAQLLCWSLCLYRDGQTDAAEHKLRRTMLENLYIIPLLLGEDYQWIEMSHGSNLSWPSWAEMTPREFLSMWTDAEKKWASDLYHGDEFTSVRDRWIEIHRKLEHVRPGPERTRLCDEAWAMKDGG
ncbi:MAG: tetratricopeptide repeat protein [Planctomycetota bacterium]|jgi:hypothetical protein